MSRAAAARGRSGTISTVTSNVRYYSVSADGLRRVPALMGDWTPVFNEVDEAVAHLAKGRSRIGLFANVDADMIWTAYLATQAVTA